MVTGESTRTWLKETGSLGKLALLKAPLQREPWNLLTLTLCTQAPPYVDNPHPKNH